MSEELKRCSSCGTLPQANTWTLHGISETRYFCPNSECPNSVRTVTLEQWQKRQIEDALNALKARIAELEAAGAKLADATQDLINALPLEFSNWEIVPVHKALLDWNEISKEREE